MRALVGPMLLVVVAACAKPGTLERSETPDEGFTASADAFYDAHLAARPGWGVSLGWHQYDGQLPDAREQALAAEVARLTSAEAEFAGMGDLSVANEHDRQRILYEIRRSLFDLQVRRGQSTNPMWYPGAVNLDAYMARDYAPVADRAAAIGQTCDALGPYLAQGQANLQPALPRTLLETAQLITGGQIQFVDEDVLPAMQGLDEAQQAALEAGLAKCRVALEGYQAFLEARMPEATDAFALGAEAYLQMLADSEGVVIDLETLEAVGRADLQRNLDALAEAAQTIDSEAEIRDVIAAVAAEKPAPDQVIATAAAQGDMLRAFLVDHQVVSIPFDDSAEVRPSPPFMRWNFAFLDAAGPFETRALPSFYYVSPPDPDWPEETQRAYVPSANDLLFTSVHELWPGHFLHHLHAKKSPSKHAQTFCTYSMSEGWAHYTEEMMYDAGLGDRDPKVQVGMLLNALLRNVRFLSSIGLHTQGMTVEESKALFIEQGFQDEGTAQQQAYRGTFDPGYLNYTLGKLMIRKLHDDWKAAQGDAYTLQGFHDTFLEYQCLPVPVIREQMLGPDAGPPL